MAEAFRLLVAGYEKPVDGARTMLDDESIGELFKAYQPKYATTTRRRRDRQHRTLVQRPRQSRRPTKGRR